MDLDLENKCALVTGGSGGIGAEIALTLAKEGCDIILVARSEAGLAQTAARIRDSSDRKITTSLCDTRDAIAIKKLSDQHHDIDIVINNAGAVPAGRLNDLTTEGIRVGWEAKVFGYLKMMECFYAKMKENERGVIINIVGMAGLRVNADVIGLTGGNAALLAMTRALGAQSPEHGIRVLGVNPSATSTERAIQLWRDQAQRELGESERWPELLKTLPFGRPAAPQDIANVVAFLASPRAGYVSGSFVNVDGGMGSRP
ncbi:SDR family oxidoreductase [Lentibacter algarum]|uniref:short-chain dehydrogenase/reductase n=1 Tax=Lentibacter algarum TaxID=576131 RepID=UPI001C0788CB|nr:short-chain dehydrogenase/reductase [Lentibacter algarum]MBU2980187.1 SDR family oxidoreductase [Lentibacter algarum]